ncbi:MAG: hypothetical protein QOC92_4882 [Acidimicrobiaceae bacterium]
MRHATPEALDQLEGLLATLRGLPGLKEKNRGTFYRGSKAFLHFHEDPAGLFADVRLREDFERFRASTKQERADLVRRVKAALTADGGLRS